jgi:phage shock protein A
VSAERDALVQALKRAEEEIARAHAAQKQAEARLAGSHAGRTPLIVQANQVGSQALIARAQAEQQRAETKVRKLEEQLQEQKAALDGMRAAVASLKAQNGDLRDQNDELQKREQKQKAAPAPSVDNGSREELKSVRQELDIARAEIQRMRTLIVNAACRVNDGTTPAEIVPFPQTGSKSATGSRHASPQPLAKSGNDVNTTPGPWTPQAA